MMGEQHEAGMGGPVTPSSSHARETPSQHKGHEQHWEPRGPFRSLQTSGRL